MTLDEQIQSKRKESSEIFQEYQDALTLAHERRAQLIEMMIDDQIIYRDANEKAKKSDDAEEELKGLLQKKYGGQ